MKELVTILLLIPLPLLGQFYHFVQPDTADIADAEYIAFANSDFGTNKIAADSISNITLSDGTDFAVEIWQYLSGRQESKELLRLESTDTASNYFAINLTANAYLEVEYTNTGGTYTVTTQNESGGSPKSTSGAVEGKDWYHIIFTRSAAGSNVLYIDGESVTFSTVTGTFKNIYGSLDLTINALDKVGLVRIYNHAVNSSEATTLYNSGRPLIDTDVSNIRLEYTHQNNTWSSPGWIVTDDSGNSNDGTTTGFDYADMVEVKDWDDQQRRGANIPLNTPYFLDWYSAADDYNVNTNNRAARSYTLSIPSTPRIWYDPAEDKTYIALTDKSAHGGNREGIVAIYDHATHYLSAGRKVGTASNGVVDDHPALAIIRHDSRTETMQEDGHNSALYFRHSTNDVGYSQQSINSPSTNAYPSFHLSGGTLYAIGRAYGNDNNTANWIHTKSGSTWAATREIVDFNNDWAYPFGTVDSEDSDKIKHFVCRRAESSEYFALAGLFSSDGNIFHNIDSTYSHNVTSSGSIDSAEYYNFLIHQIDSIGIGQSAYPTCIKYLDGKYLVFVNEYDTLTNTSTKDRLYWSDGTEDWNTKEISFLSDKGFIYPVHISGSTYDVWFSKSSVISRWRTTDFFDTFTHQEDITYGALPVSLFGMTENQADADEIIFIGEGVNSGLQNHLFIYVYDKTTPL